MVPASWPFLAYVILPAWPGPSSSLLKTRKVWALVGDENGDRCNSSIKSTPTYHK